jgi:hypothetical protein
MSTTKKKTSKKKVSKKVAQKKQMTHRLAVKPLSANAMWGWKGRRKFKSAEYLEYQNEIRDTILTLDGDAFTWIFEDSQVCFDVKAGLSNRGADLDNCIKPLLDTYQSMYEDFNDNKVYQLTMEKFIVSKGDEYLEVQVEEYVKDNDNKEDIHS